MQALGRFRYDAMIPNGLMLIFSGAPCVIRGVLGEISVIWAKSQMHDGDVKLRRLGPDHVRQAVAESSEDSVERQFGSAVVAIEIAMMQVVGVGARGEFAIQIRNAPAGLDFIEDSQDAMGKPGDNTIFAWRGKTGRFGALLMQCVDQGGRAARISQRRPCRRHELTSRSAHIGGGAQQNVAATALIAVIRLFLLKESGVAR